MALLVYEGDDKRGTGPEKTREDSMLLSKLHVGLLVPSFCPLTTKSPVLKIPFLNAPRLHPISADIFLNFYPLHCLPPSLLAK